MTLPITTLVPSRAPMLLDHVAGLCPPSRRTTPDAWGAANRVYPPTSGMPGPRDPALTPYAIPFGRAIAGRKHRRAAMVTSAQSGKSETLLDVIGQRLDQAPAPILYVGPSKQFVTERFEPRIVALLEEAPTLAGKVAHGKRATKTRKLIAGVPLVLAHAGSSTALKSDPFALALTDEADELMANVKGQGDPLALIDVRGDSYADFVHAIVSTPSEGRPETALDPVSGLEFWTSSDPEKILSTIWRVFLEGTRHHWCWPCPACAGFFVPRMSCLQIPDIETKDDAGRVTKRLPTPAEAKATAYLACPRCGGIITENEKAEMNARGVVVAPGQRVTPEGEVVGEPAENSCWSLFASGLASPFKSFGDRAADLVAARASGRPDRVQAVVNGSFGEVYAPGPVNIPKWQSVRECALPYLMGEVPREVIKLVAGVDVQVLSLYVVIRGFGSRGSSWLVSAEQLHGPTKDDEVWDALAATLTMSHGGLHVEKAMIDSGFRPDKPDAGDEHRVYEFCRRYKWLVHPSKGRAKQDRPLIVKQHEVRPDGKRPSYSLELVNVDTDHFKSLVMSRIATPPGRAGAFGLPEDISENYCKQMVSEVRQIVAGRAVWTQITGDNHYLDAEALAAAAGRLVNVERIPEGVSRDWDDNAPLPLPKSQGKAREADTGSAQTAVPSEPPQAKPPVKKSLRETLGDRMAERARRLHRGGP